MSGNTSVSNNQTPQYAIRLAGQEISQADPKGLESLSIEDHVEMIGVSELTFGGDDGLEWSSVKMGDELEISVGESSYKVFKGVVTGLRHGFQQGRDTLTILAMDPLCKLAASRQVNAKFDDMTDSDVARKIIEGCGVPVGVIDSTREVRKYQMQRNESGLQIVRRLAARNGYIVRANEGKIDFIKAQSSDPPIEVQKKHLVSLDYTFSPKALPSKMTVYGWDPNTKKRVEGTATKADIQPVGGGTVSVSESPIWQGDAAFISDVEVTTQEGAKDIAVAELNRIAMGFLKGRAIIQGNGEMHIGVKVKFTEHQGGFNPEVLVQSSRHRVFPGSGFTSEIVFCSNTYPNASGGGGSVGQMLASTPLASGGGQGGGQGT